MLNTVYTKYTNFPPPKLLLHMLYLLCTFYQSFKKCTILSQAHVVYIAQTVCLFLDRLVLHIILHPLYRALMQNVCVFAEFNIMRKKSPKIKKHLIYCYIYFSPIC